MADELSKALHRLMPCPCPGQHAKAFVTTEAARAFLKRSGTAKANQKKGARWEDTLRGLARQYGYLAHHMRASLSQSGRWMSAISGDPGFPDWVFAKNLLDHPTASPDCFVVETKAGNSKTSSAQRVWIESMKAAGIEVHVWNDERHREEARERFSMGRRGGILR